MDLIDVKSYKLLKSLLKAMNIKKSHLVVNSIAYKSMVFLIQIITL